MNAPQIIKDRLETLGVKPGWLANHPANPVGRIATYNALRGYRGVSTETFLAWCSILGLGIKPAGPRPRISAEARKRFGKSPEETLAGSVTSR
jgi:hypothetical protein